MKPICVAYYSRTGNTRLMAECVLEGVTGVGVPGVLRPIDELKPADVAQVSGLILGSPVYYGLPAAPVKAFLDASVVMHGQLAGRVGGAFASSANIGGGNETAILAMLQALLVHGMVVQGAVEGDHYGPVAINRPDERAQGQCRALGKRIAVLASTLLG